MPPRVLRPRRKDTATDRHTHTTHTRTETETHRQTHKQTQPPTHTIEKNKQRNSSRFLYMKITIWSTFSMLVGGTPPMTATKAQTAKTDDPQETAPHAGDTSVRRACGQRRADENEIINENHHRA